jgi:hypothetical protein
MKIIVHPHSVVELITNSSTEIFVCKRGHSETEVEKIFSDLMKIFYVQDNSYGYGWSIYQVDQEPEDPWDYPMGSVIINVDQHMLPYKMTELLRSIFEVQED